MPVDLLVWTSGQAFIRLKPGEEFKTAFQTHFGQFEFRVMPFGFGRSHLPQEVCVGFL